MESWKDLRTRIADSHLVVPHVFSARECQAIVKLCDSYPQSDGLTWDGKGFSVNSEHRSLSTAYIPRAEATEWIYARLDKVMLRCAAHWGLDVRETTEELKYLVYRAGSHFAQWHADTGHEYACLRKVSISVELSDRDEFDGGELQIFPGDRGHAAGEAQRAGTSVVFPSHRHHRVTPVTRGVRNALVNWMSGPPLR